MWLAILVTIIASAGNNVGKALQKEATRQLPRFSIERKILLQYARSRQYLVGLAADLSGAVLMIAAFALAPVSDSVTAQSDAVSVLMLSNVEPQMTSLEADSSHSSIAALPAGLLGAARVRAGVGDPFYLLTLLPEGQDIKLSAAHVY